MVRKLLDTRRAASVGALVLALVAASPAAAVKVRHRGPAVRLVQQLVHVGVDGVYGPQTAAAVKAFQSAHGLTADGVIGPATWAALGIRGRHPVLERRGTHGGRPGIPGAVFGAIAAANRIATLPYRYGGGHGSFSDSAYDC